MARKLSPLAISSALAQQTGSAWLFLVEIMHPDIPESIKWVNNTEPIISNGQEYEPYPFTLELAIDDEANLPEVRMLLDNVERALIALSRASEIAPEFIIRLVLSDTPDVVEIEVVGLTLLDISYDAFQMTGTLYADDLLNTRYPKDVVSIAAGYQGLFRQ